jgi:hypothetical protein
MSFGNNSKAIFYLTAVSPIFAENTQFVFEIVEGKSSDEKLQPFWPIPLRMAAVASL